MSYVELLKATDIFAKLSSDELGAIARCVVERSAVSDEILIREGEPGESLFLVRSGEVVVEKNVKDGKVALAKLGKGAVFGEMSLIDNFPTSASVRATTGSTFLLIGRLDLNVLLTWDTVLASKMWRSFTEMLCYRVRASNERLLDRFGTDASKELIGSTDGIQAR